jgi:glutathione S-transferase
MEQEQDTKVVLYWLERSRSQRVLWLLEELKIKYEVKTYNRINKLAPPEFKEIHPLGKFPVVTIESKAIPKPLVLAESGLIFEYLISHYGSWLAPKQWVEGKEGHIGGETEEWTRYRYYMHFAEGSLMPYLVIAFLFNTIKTVVPFFIKPVARLIIGAVESNYLGPSLMTTYEFLESQIESSPNNGQYLCGSQLTGVDILMSFPLLEARGQAGLNKASYPKLWAYLDRLEGHAGYKTAAQKIVDIKGSSSSHL